MLPYFLRLPAVIAALALALAGAAVAAPADDLRDAQKMYAEGKISPAMDKVDAYLKAQPREPQGRFLKGLLLTEQKKVSEAIKVFTALTEDYPELPEPYNNLAVLYASQGNYDKAKSALELAIHTHPSYATAHENLGDIYAQLASRAYDRALQLDKNNSSAQVTLSLVKDLFGAPKAGAPARQEPSKVAKAEPAKVTKAEPVKPAPANVETAKVDAAKSAKLPAATDEKGAVKQAVEVWARAWSAKDVKGYLASYAPDFETPDGASRADWEKLRTDRIERPKSIKVTVAMQSVTIDGAEATAVFRQSYRSDTFKATDTKTLRFVKVDGRWLIKQERVGG